jgi:response regulator RpfG family c-di-GMP phosphodiesterase
MTMLENLRRDPWGVNAAVILLTNLIDDRKIQEARQRGVYEYLIKTGWTMNDLVSAVRTRLAITKTNLRHAEY